MINALSFTGMTLGPNNKLVSVMKTCISYMRDIPLSTVAQIEAAFIEQRAKDDAMNVEFRKWLVTQSGKHSLSEWKQLFVAARRPL